MQLTHSHISRVLNILSSVILLSLGGMIYVFLRPRVILLFQVIDQMGLGSWVDALRARIPHLALPEWLIYCLPNGLWSASYILLMDALMRERGIREQAAWACVIPALGVLSELAQGMGILAGTFDPIDLACYAVPYAIYMVILLRREQIDKKIITI